MSRERAKSSTIFINGIYVRTYDDKSDRMQFIDNNKIDMVINVEIHTNRTNTILAGGEKLIVGNTALDLDFDLDFDFEFDKTQIARIHKRSLVEHNIKMMDGNEAILYALYSIHDIIKKVKNDRLRVLVSFAPGISESVTDEFIKYYTASISV